jgi:hypothetical protein
LDEFSKSLKGSITVTFQGNYFVWSIFIKITRFWFVKENLRAIIQLNLLFNFHHNFTTNQYEPDDAVELTYSKTFLILSQIASYFFKNSMHHILSPMYIK